MKNVLLAFDGSDHAENAAWLFAHLPHDQQIQLTVVTVLEVPHVMHRSLSAEWIEQSVARERDLALENFLKLERMFAGANVSLQHEVREGSAGHTIVDLAKELEADLVVVGSQGHSPISRMLLGSTSDYVATHAPCSVLVVRPTGLQKVKRPLRIAIAYNGSPPAQAAVEEVADICKGQETVVRVLSVASYITGFYGEMVPDALAIKQEAQDALDRAVAQLRRVNPRTTGLLIEQQHVGDALVSFAKDIKADVLVIGETPHSRLGRLLLGSVSRFVLRHLESSVWVARNRSVHVMDAAATPAEDATTP